MTSWQRKLMMQLTGDAIIPSFSQDGYRMSRGDTLTVKKSQTITYKLDRAPGSSSVHSEQADLAINRDKY